MFPVLFKLGPLTLHSYGLMIAIGFLTALYLTQRDIGRLGFDAGFVSEMGFWCLLIGVASTRVLHIIMFPDNYSWKDPVGWIAIWNGGLVFQGALPATVLYAYYGVKKRKLPFLPLVDVAICYLPLGHAIGRLGCFLNGCCYGHRTSLPWGIRFPRVPFDLSDSHVTGSPAYVAHCLQYPEMSYATSQWSYRVHPTQLYEAAGLLLICGLLVVFRRVWNPFPGFAFGLYLLFYGVLRLFIEFVRGDGNPTGLAAGMLSDQQVFALAMAAAGALFFLVLWRRQRQHSAGNVSCGS